MTLTNIPQIRERDGTSVKVVILVEPGSSNFMGVWFRQSDTNFEGMWSEGHCPPMLQDGGTAGKSVAVKFRSFGI